MTYYAQVRFTIGDYEYNNYNNSAYDNGVICEPVDKTKASYETIPKTVTYQGITYDVIGVKFTYCKSLTSVPESNAQFREIQRPGFTYLYGGIAQAFRYCESLTDISEFANWDLTSAPTVTDEHYTSFAVTKLDVLFGDCKSLEDISPLEHLDISKVRKFSNVFQGCISLSDITPLTDWDTSGIFDMSNMFASTSVSDLTPLENWDLSGINTGTGIFANGGINGMFSHTNVSDLTPLANWDISNANLLANMFRGCTLLSDLTPLSNWDTSNIVDMSSMFYGCTSLVDISAIAGWDISSVTSLDYFFKNCTSLSSVSLLNWNYASVTKTDCMFQGCTSLSGNIAVKNTLPTLTSANMFADTVNDIYIVNKDQNPNDIKAYWQAVASSYSNVHYEADDNTVPSLSYNVVRVGAMNSETQVENGEYAYINATVVLFNDYLPTGWSVALGDKTLTLDTVTQTPIWTDINVGYVYTLKCWRSLGDTARHTFTLQVSDNITNESSVLKASHLSAIVAKTLSKAYKLVDYYHESDPNDPNYDKEGMAIGKFAEQAYLFDVDMPSRFRDLVTVDKLVGEIKMWAGNTAPNGWLVCDGSAISRTDYPLLFDAIGTLWGAGDGSTTFNLPNLVGKVPVGQDTADTAFDVVGETGGAKTVTLDATMIPAHTHGNKSLSGQFHALAYQGGQATNGIITRTSYMANVNSTSSGNKWGTVYYTVNASHTHDSVGGSQAHNNLQPYAVVKYIICAE